MAIRLTFFNDMFAGYDGTSAPPGEPWQTTPHGTIRTADIGQQFQLTQMANQGIR